MEKWGRIPIFTNISLSFCQNFMILQSTLVVSNFAGRGKKTRDSQSLKVKIRLSKLEVITGSRGMGNTPHFKNVKRAGEEGAMG